MVCAILVVAATPVGSAYAEPATVTFSDPHLESAVRSALSKPSGDITNAEMSALTSLTATSQRIADLDGLQYATHLASLNLSNNEIGDVSQVAALTELTSLDLSDNEIATITALGALHPHTADLSHNWLPVDGDSEAKSVIDGWLSAETSASITYLPQGRTTKCSVSGTYLAIGYGARTTITGSLIDSGSAKALGDYSMQLQSSGDGIAFANTAATCVTTPSGAFAFVVAPSTATCYRVVFAGSSCRYLASASQAVCVAPRVYLSTPTAPAIASRSKSFFSYALLKQRHAAGGYPAKLQCDRYERQSNGTYTWVLRKTVSAKAANYSAYTKVTAAVSLPLSGRWRIRAYHPADSLNAETCSGYRYLNVEDRRIEPAIKWAKARLRSHTWDHYCLRFANQCYERGAHARIRHYSTAKQAANALHAAAHPSTNAPRGAYVFYHSWHGKVDLGHVGISLGNGKMISDNGGQGVVIRPIKYGSRYIGWAAPPARPRITDWDQLTGR